MKKLLVLISLFASITMSFAQAPEKATTVIVTMTDSVGLREKITKVLTDRGYTISSGKTATIITTAPRTLKNDARVAYFLEIKGKEIFITGKLPIAGQSAFPIANQGKKGTPILNGWEEMEKIAKAFGVAIRYQ